jgi:hypothetical protein
MSSEPPVADKEDKEVSSEESGKVLQNPQLPRDQEASLPSPKLAEQKASAPSGKDSLIRPTAEDPYEP